MQWLQKHSFARKDYGTSTCSSFERAKHENTFSAENTILVLSDYFTLDMTFQYK
jgi:hypothetical protein